MGKYVKNEKFYLWAICTRRGKRDNFNPQIYKCLINKKDNAENVENEVKSWQNSLRSERKGTEIKWNETERTQKGTKEEQTELNRRETAVSHCVSIN